MVKPKTKANLIHRRHKKQAIRPGMQLGDLHVIMRVATKSGSGGGQRWRLECACGNRITTPQFYLVRKEFPKRHCGCRLKEGVNPNPRERGIFYMMHRRCYNNTHVAYKHYGGASPPIGVCAEWNKDIVGNDVAWKNFIFDMGPAPTKTATGVKAVHTLDRIDPYKWYGWVIGDDGQRQLNCRWATATEQMNNLKRHWAHPDDRQKVETFNEEVPEFNPEEDEDAL